MILSKRACLSRIKPKRGLLYQFDFNGLDERVSNTFMENINIIEFASINIEMIRKLLVEEISLKQEKCSKNNIEPSHLS